MTVDTGRGGYRIEPLRAEHDRSAFSSGVEALDTYLRKQARQDVFRRTANVFVLLGGDSRVLGYYTLSQLSMALTSLPDALSRRLPRYPLVPATLIGRFAVDSGHQRIGLGSLLLIDALKRSRQASAQVASFAAMVDATNEDARRFYLAHDFLALPSDQRRLFIPMATLDALFVHDE